MRRVDHRWCYGTDTSSKSNSLVRLPIDGDVAQGLLKPHLDEFRNLAFLRVVDDPTGFLHRHDRHVVGAGQESVRCRNFVASLLDGPSGTGALRVARGAKTDRRAIQRIAVEDHGAGHGQATIAGATSADREQAGEQE